MEKITSHQVVGLMEAYSEVHAPQINEEQLWEEVETWVNSLVEEGYDLSEFTWEEMYEHYLDEAIGQPGSAGMVNWQDKNSGQVRSGYKSSSDGKLYKNYNDAKAAKNSRDAGLGMQQGLQRVFRAGGGAAAVAGSPSRPAQSPLDVMKQGSTNLQRQQQRPPVPAPGVRPVGPEPTTARPAPAPAGGARPTPAPSTAKPAAGPTGKPLVGGIERRTPTSQEMQAAAAKRSAASTSTLAQATAAASKPPAYNPVTKPAPTPTATPVATKPPAPGAGKDYLMKRQLNQNFDVFDVIKGHLIDEGYADTEEAALQIMASMSEEWRESIVENRGMSHSGGKPGASGDGGKPTGITGGTTYKMKGWDDDKDPKKSKVKGA